MQGRERNQSFLDTAVDLEILNHDLWKKKILRIAEKEKGKTLNSYIYIYISGGY